MGAPSILQMLQQLLGVTVEACVTRVGSLDAGTETTEGPDKCRGAGQDGPSCVGSQLQRQGARD